MLVRGMTTVGLGTERTLAREQASHEALIFRGFGSPFELVAAMVVSGTTVMSSISCNGS